MDRQIAPAAATPVAVIVFDENEARSRRTRLLAFSCCCLSVGLVAVGLLSPFWLEAEGFHQGLWRYCTWTAAGAAAAATSSASSASSSSTSSSAALVCFDNADSAWMFVCRVLCCLSFVFNLLIVFVLATNLLPRGGRPSSTSLCKATRLLICPNAVIVGLIVASTVMMSVVVVLFPAMFLREKDLYRLRFNRSQWFFSWTYGVTCGAIPFLLTSAAIITYDSLISASASSSPASASHQTTLLKQTPLSQPLAFKEPGRQSHGCP